VVDFFLFVTFISMKNNNLFNRKALKFFRSFLRNKATSAEAALCDTLKSRRINHPGRNQSLQYSNNHCTAATPPLKGGENIKSQLIPNIKIRLPFLIIPVRAFSDSWVDGNWNWGV
jgi:hypothetical protein